MFAFTLDFLTFSHTSCVRPDKMAQKGRVTKKVCLI